jgi:hypothetical protein
MSRSIKRGEALPALERDDLAEQLDQTKKPESVLPIFIDGD